LIKIHPSAKKRCGATKARNKFSFLKSEQKKAMGALSKQKTKSGLETVPAARGAL
jgi:hypothetical protein